MAFKLDGYEVGFATNKPQITNCPNCGAVVVGSKCEYCGTLFNNLENTIIGGIANMRAEDMDGNVLWKNQK